MTSFPGPSIRGLGPNRISKLSSFRYYPEMENQRLWSVLPNEIKVNFETHSQTLEFKRGQRLYKQGDQPKGIYFVNKGLVGLVLTGAASGKEHLLRFFRQGQFLGHRSLFSKEEHHATAIALEPTVAKLVPRQVILATLETHPQLLKEIVIVLAKELRQCETQHVLILENEILVRVAQALVYIKDLHPDHNWTRQEIANFCASTTSTVIKALSELEDRGLISQKGRSIEVLNRDALIALQEGAD